MRDAGQWGEIVDGDWRWSYMTDELRLSYGGLLGLADVELGEHYLGTAAVETRLGWRAGPKTLELARNGCAAIGPLVLADTAGGRDELRAKVHPHLGDIIDGLTPNTGRRFRSRGAACTAATSGRPLLPPCACATRQGDSPAPRSSINRPPV